MTGSATTEQRVRTGTAAPYREYCRPVLGALLEATRLAKHFHRGRDVSLWYHDENGSECEIFDFLGGFGAGLFGHNHPVLKRSLIDSLGADVPFNAQLSDRHEAGRLAERLSEWVGRSTGRRYVSILSSSGAECVESAIKHAALARRSAARALRREFLREVQYLKQHVDLSGSPTLDAAGHAALRAAHVADAAGTWADLIRAIEAHDEAVVSQAPVIGAVTGSFHGKTSGALSITDNAAFHLDGLAGPLRRAFVAFDDADSASDVFAAHRGTYLILRVRDGAASVDAVGFSALTALFVEPMQGESGIHPASAEFLKTCRRLCDESGVPLVFDEIQCGMGRTGTFLYSEQLDVRADYYLIGKSLGGGLAKIAATMIEASRYEPDLDLVHSSTFADDALSARVALAALELLSRDRIPERCRERGTAIADGLRRLAAAHPGVVTEVRGSGLLLGCEFAIPAVPTPMFHTIFDQGLFGYLAASYLLNVHGIRVAPSLSSPSTLRIEPSAYVDETHVAALLLAMDCLCEIVAKQSSYRLLRHVVGGEHVVRPGDGGEERARVRAARAHRPAVRTVGDVTPASPDEGAVAFICHPIEARDLASWDSSLAEFSADELERLVRLLYPYVDCAVGVQIPVRGRGGSATYQSFPLLLDPGTIRHANDHGRGKVLQDKVQDAVDKAVAMGKRVIGLGGFTSSIARNCRQIAAPADVLITSGNAYTTATGIRMIEIACRQHDLKLDQCVCAVVGATGNIGEIYARVIAESVRELILVGREGSNRRLHRIADEVAAAAAGVSRIRIATSLDELGAADVIVSATNAPEPVVYAEMLKPGPVLICDIAVPGDVDPDLVRKRPDAVVIKGGIVSLRGHPEFHVDGVPLEDGSMFACMAETLTMGFARSHRSLSYGPIRVDQVLEAERLATAEGFELRRAKIERSA